MALLRSIKSVEELVEKLEGDEKIGARTVLRSLDAPVRQIAKNAGVEGAVIIEKVVQKDEMGFGYDALKNKYVNMFESGIIDPAKVTRSAVQNAASIASMLLTTEVLVVEEPKEETAPATPDMGGMGGMY